MAKDLVYWAHWQKLHGATYICFYEVVIQTRELL